MPYRKIIKILLLMNSINFTAFTVNSAFAFTATPPKMKQNVEKINIDNIFKDFENFSGQFTQVQFSTGKNKILTGDFSFAQPNKFKWNYIKPMQQLIQSDGKNLYIYDKDLQQISIKKIDEALNTSPIAVFFQGKEWQKHFSYTITTISPLDEFKQIPYWIELIPKEKDSIYKNIYLGLENKQAKYIPKVINFNDNLGNKGYIELYNIQKLNFNSNYFDFIMPNGVDIIK